MKETLTVEFLVDMKGKIHEQFEVEKPRFLRKTDIASLDDQRLVAIPALVNGHVHSADFKLISKGYGKNTSALVGKNGLKKELLAKLTVEEQRDTIRQFVRKSKTEGSFVVFDFREGGVEGSRIAREASREEEIQYFILGRTSETEEIEQLSKWADGIGIPDATRWDRQKIEEMIEQAKSMGLFTAIHVSETKKARNRFLEREGESDIEFALDLGIDMLVHLTHATQRDLELLIRSEAIPVFCPRSNAYLSNGAPPISRFLEKNTPFLLGTDNVFISSPNLFREADFLARINEEKKNKDIQLIFQAITGTHPKLTGRLGKKLPAFKHEKYLILTYPYGLDKEDLLAWIVLHSHPGNVIGYFAR